MKTNWGWRERPHFLIKSWINLGDVGGDDAKVVSGKPAPALLSHAVTNVTEGAPTAAEPTLREETGDAIPF